MLENMHSDYIVLSEAEIDHFGVGPEGLITVEEDDY